MKPLTTTFASAAAGAGGYALATLGLGSITFGAAAAPAILTAAGASLPPLWNLLSSLPPKPVKEYFPGIRLLFDLSTDDMKPVSMPAWQKSLCLSVVAATALGAASPEFKSALIGDDDSPVILVVDNGWTAAHNWDARQIQMAALLRDAAKDERPVVLIPTADKPDDDTPYYKVISASYAETLLPAITPQSWPVDHGMHVELLDSLRADLGANTGGSVGTVYWLSDGLAPAHNDFILRLQDFDAVQIFEADITSGPHLLSLDKSSGATMTVTVMRPDSAAAYTLDLVALNETGQPVLQSKAVFEEGQTTTQGVFEIPTDIRENLARIIVRGENTAGATLLLDENWRQRSLGVVETGLNEPLLDGANFVAQAVKTYTNMQRGTVDDLLRQNLSVITLTDEAVLNDADRAALLEWVNAGGTLVRFAGPNLAAMPDDPLLPVTLRSGTRALNTSFGGARGTIGHIAPSSPLQGLQPPESLKINRIVLSEPGPDLADRTWMTLDDGTPFITARGEGEGQIVLIHTSANMEWSNFALSGDFFLKTMEKIVTNAQGNQNDTGLSRDLPALLSLNGQGALQRAQGGVKALSQDIFEQGIMNADHPPGYYGNYTTRMAYNVSDSVTALTPIAPDLVPEKMLRAPYEAEKQTQDYGAWFLLAALGAMMGDMAVRTRRGRKDAGFSARDIDEQNKAYNAPEL